MSTEFKYCLLRFIRTIIMSWDAKWISGHDSVGVGFFLLWWNRFDALKPISLSSYVSRNFAGMQNGDIYTSGCSTSHRFILSCTFSHDSAHHTSNHQWCHCSLSSPQQKNKTSEQPRWTATPKHSASEAGGERGQRAPGCSAGIWWMLSCTYRKGGGRASEGQET